MKLNVGDYVRTKDGYIGKVLIVTEYCVNIENKKVVQIGDIKYCSSDILNILEIGDYINGSKLLDIDYAEDADGNCDKVHYKFYFEDDDKDINEYYEDLEVKSIVTKEQFEQMKYRVED